MDIGVHGSIGLARARLAAGQVDALTDLARGDDGVLFLAYRA